MSGHGIDGPGYVNWDDNKLPFVITAKIPEYELEVTLVDEVIEVPDWIMQSRDEDAYRAFWQDRAAEFMAAGAKAQEAFAKQLAKELDLEPGEVTTSSDVVMPEGLIAPAPDDLSDLDK